MEESREKTILSKNIRKLADSLGIDFLGFAEASEFEGYIVNRARRRDPRLSLSDAKTIIVAGIYIGGLVLPSWDKSYMGRTSRLFLSGFFNDVVKQLEPIATLLRKERYTALICDDSKNKGSILPLKLAAIRAGLGWQGKNSMLVRNKSM
jgi:epoxyqueuosine reductase QueG